MTDYNLFHNMALSTEAVTNFQESFEQSSVLTTALYETPQPSPYVRILVKIWLVMLCVSVFTQQEQPIATLPTHHQWGIVVPTMVGQKNYIHTYQSIY